MRAPNFTPIKLLHVSTVTKAEYQQAKETLDAMRKDKLSAKDLKSLSNLRNIGISAHIDSGKTTFTERVLYYTGRIKAVHEVRGRDNVGAKMDSMDLEREKGITIQSAATYCSWRKNEEDYRFNLIDTPGHIDFTIEVERALRVLDGGVLVVCAVAGVQSQTITVDNQMRRYNVPRITFINKMDRLGANPFRAIKQLNKKLKLPAAAVQIPIGSESELEGVIDIIKMNAIYNKGSTGEVLEVKEIPEELRPLAKEKRQLLIETLADVDDEMAEIFLEEREPTITELQNSIRNATIARKFSPVLMGSALANTGIQPVLDAIVDYLPDPSEILNHALDTSNNETQVDLIPSSKEPFVGLAFKLEEGKYGQLTYIRVYQGTLKKGSFITNVQNGKKVKVSRLVRMHSDEMEDVNEVESGEICATFGIDCASGNTFTDGSVKYSMSSMFVPDSVVSLSIIPKTKDSLASFSKALNKFQKEDPTFKVHFDNESKQTIISGMGELHLEIYVERMKREYNVDCTVGKPQVAYRESITCPAAFDYIHKKQSGGAGQFARVGGEMRPIDLNEASTTPTKDLTFNKDNNTNGDNNQFATQIIGGIISEKFLAACAKGFQEACAKGPLTGHKVINCRMLINDGATHSVDSNELSFRTATVAAFKQAFLKANPVILEPIMKMEVTSPNEFQGNVISLLNKLQALIQDTEDNGDEFTLQAECPLSTLFGFVTSLRASTQGKGEFSLEFSHYAPTLPNVQAELIKEYQKRQTNKR